MSLSLDVARIASSALESLNGQLHIGCGFFGCVAGYDPPIHIAAADRELGVHVQHPAKITRFAEAEWPNGNVRLNRGAVIVAATHMPNVAIVPRQQQFPFVLANHVGRVIVLKPHRPECLGHCFINPVRIASAARA